MIRMNLLRNLRPVFAVVFVILILVIYRTAGHNRFKPDAAKWAGPSVTGSNIITPEKVASLSGEKIFIAIDGYNPFNSPETKNIESVSILRGDNIKMMKSHNGPVIIMSSERSTSSKIWMILSQLGLEDLYILSESNDDEVFKYKFRPDTTARPEL